MPAPPPPWAPGNEGTGIVSAVGSEITEVKVGDRVVLPPTAILMLDEFTDVPEGSYVAQDAANSGVGRSLIAVAHARGLKTINPRN